MSFLFDRKSLSFRTLKTIGLDISDTSLMFLTIFNVELETNLRSTGIQNTHLLCNDRRHSNCNSNKPNLGRKNSINGTESAPYSKY